MDYFRLQLFFVLMALLIANILLFDQLSTIELWSMGMVSLAMIHHAVVIFPFIPFKKKVLSESKHPISLLSVNVLQKNNNYEALLQLIEEVKPHLLLTMESNQDWEEALQKLPIPFPYSHKIAKENRYGMHLYSRLEVLNSQEHKLISNKFPSIEATIKDENNEVFTFWGVHPPPPSPTEAPSSKQKDGEFMMLAKEIKTKDVPVLVAGDFNSVCWSRSSKRFAKFSGLKDARLGRGFHSTFPVKPKIFRFPIDLLFHSNKIVIQKLETLSDIGSDHLPLLSIFSVIPTKKAMNNELGKEEKEEIEELIERGKNAARKEDMSK
jgi:endonuclease/exonuclease/phosphatase (EEP) superfamily protein YafD